MILEAFSTRHYVEFDIDGSFMQTVDEEDEYSFTAGFTLKDEDTDEKIALVNGVFFDEVKISNKGQDIVDIADMFDGDTENAMSALVSSKIYKQELCDDKMVLPLFSCYLKHLYVYPKHREKGIARYILNNIESIFLHCFNTYIRSIVVYPQPQEPEEIQDGMVGTSWEHSPDEDGSMKKRMVAIIEKDGFMPIERGLYAKTYSNII